MPSADHPDVGPVHPRQIRLWNHIFLMRMLGVIYAFTAVMVLFFSTEIINATNYLPRILHIGETLTPPTDHLWVTLAGSGMLSLSLLAFFASQAPYQRGYAIIHLVAKLVSASVLALFFMNEKPYLLYGLVALIDGFIAIASGWSLLWIGRRPK